MRTITIDKVDGEYKVDVNVKGEGGSFDPPDWVKSGQTQYGLVDPAVPPVGTKVRCYLYNSRGGEYPSYQMDAVGDGNTSLEDFFGWDLRYIGNIGEIFIIHQYAGNH